MAIWSANEQLMLELVNRARLDPLGEAARFGIDLNQGLAPGTLSSASLQPLAPNGLLNESARAHSQWMLDTDIFSHTGAGGSSPGDRMGAAGYQFTGAWSWGENIAWQGTTGAYVESDFVIAEHQNLFLSSGHRENILNGYFREVGIGIQTGEFSGYNTLMSTQNFATSGTGSFITGVAYNDSDNDAFYDIGEARAGVAVATSVGGVIDGTTSAAAGGYAVAIANGMATVTFSGGGLAATYTATVDATAGNVKVDLVNGFRIDTSATTTLGGANAFNAKLLGAAALNLTGNNAANALVGNKSNNILDGLGGNDNIQGGAGNDQLRGGLGNDILAGGIGNDGLVGQGGNDTLRGDGGNDALNGASGNDTMWGGVGKDVFVFNSALVAANVDQLADFVAVDDTIRLDDLVFTGLVVGATLAAAAFTAGPSATTADHRIIHDLATGSLYYDGDGNGAALQVKFATLTPNIALTAADFQVV